MDVYQLLSMGPLLTDLERAKLVETFKDLYHEYGRNFICFYRSRFCRTLEEMGALGKKSNIYFDEVDFDKEVEIFRKITVLRDGFHVVETYGSFFEYAELMLEKRSEVCRKYGTVEEKSDWLEWSRYLEKKCEALNKKYPGVFCNRLWEFVLPMKTLLLLGLVNDTVPLSPLDQPIKWNCVVEQIETIRNEDYCGFMYGILEFWLQNISDHFKNYPPPERQQHKFWKPLKLKIIRKSQNNYAMNHNGGEGLFVAFPLPNLFNGFSKCFKWNYPLSNRHK